ncbi:hypothetical protein J1614_003470 [Plenodomus biglobosus]|nr:hypothetical protein J1614_003470 [Plenodomus biglobosus]
MFKHYGKTIVTSRAYSASRPYHPGRRHFRTINPFSPLRSHSTAPNRAPTPSPSIDLNQTIRGIETKVSNCEHILSYTATSKPCLLTALNASGCLISYANTTYCLPNNSTLAVLGDARMAGVLCKWWWERTPRPQKGQWTQIRHDKCGNGALARLGRRRGLHDCIILSPGADVVSDRMVATVIEALFGAVYLDGGEGELERVMRVLEFDRHGYL